MQLSSTKASIEKFEFLSYALDSATNKQPCVREPDSKRTRVTGEETQSGKGMLRESAFELQGSPSACGLLCLLMIMDGSSCVELFGGVPCGHRLAVATWQVLPRHLSFVCAFFLSL